MHKQRVWVGACAVLVTVWLNGVAAGITQTVITFGDTIHDIGNAGSIVESDFQYNAIGNSWSIQTGVGATTPFPTGPALVTFWGMFPAVGNTLTFTRLDNAEFLFTSIDVRGRLELARNDVVAARGYLDGIEVASQVLQSSTLTWRTDLAAPGFATPIDELRLVQIESNGSCLVMDNVTFIEVPEPASCLVLVLVTSFHRRPRSGATHSIRKATAS